MPTKKEQAMQFLQPAAQSVGYDDIVRSAVKIAENTSSKPAAQSVSQIEGGVINQNILQAKSNENEATSTSEIADSNLSDFERWQKDNPGAGAYEYAYIKTAKAPKDPDANKANKRNRLAGFADLAMLLSDGITAVAGGNVNRRTTSATAVNNEAMEAIRERARQLRETYDTGLTKARYQDLADKTKRPSLLISMPMNSHC
jgi:uncharacterized protein YbjQ (UPF0145 family)